MQNIFLKLNVFSFLFGRIFVTDIAGSDRFFSKTQVQHRKLFFCVNIVSKSPTVAHEIILDWI